jgi:hypothetical protein
MVAHPLARHRDLVEAKPQPPGFDPPRPAESAGNLHFVGADPDPTHSRPLSLAFCKQEITGSIPVGSTQKRLQIRTRGGWAMAMNRCGLRQRRVPDGPTSRARVRVRVAWYGGPKP